MIQVLIIKKEDKMGLFSFRKKHPELGSFKDPRNSQTYKTVNIGSQEWMAENLNVSHFRNGDPIPEAKSDEEWNKAGINEQPAWCYNDNDPSNGRIYGKLYNWYAVNDPRGLAPEGWHIPCDDEWGRLIDYLGGVDAAGSKLKETGITLWDRPNKGATNETGFTALPGGFRDRNGYFCDVGSTGRWWSATEGDADYAWGRDVAYNDSFFHWRLSSEKEGFSVRCLRD